VRQDLQTFNPEVAADEGLRHVDSLDIDLYTVLLAV